MESVRQIVACVSESYGTGATPSDIHEKMLGDVISSIDPYVGICGVATY